MIGVNGANAAIDLESHGCISALYSLCPAWELCRLWRQRASRFAWFRRACEETNALIRALLPGGRNRLFGIFGSVRRANGRPVGSTGGVAR